LSNKKEGDKYSATHRQNHVRIPRGTSLARAQNTTGGKILLFSTEMAVYLGNGTG